MSSECFLTSNQNNPGEILIHYQIIDKEDKSGEFRIGDLRKKGGVITYNKKTHELGENKLDEQARSVLKQFGEVAGKIEELFGVQQIELGAANGQVYVFQSRDINLSNPADAPRLAHYETLSEELNAIGYGYYYLPILVIESLDKAHTEFKKSEEYRRLEAEYISASRNQEPEQEEKLKALNQFTEAERNKYKEELLSFARVHPEYILVIKDAEDIVWEWKGLLLGGKSYDFLNLLASKAKVVIRDKNQNAIRHEDWNNVESGGITIIPPEETGYGGFVSSFRYARQPGTRPLNTMLNRPSQKRSNVTIQETGVIGTGDYLNVLSNIDGVFVWVGNPLSGAIPISNDTPANNKGSSPIAGNNLGGIDFRNLPIVNQAANNLSVGIGKMPNLNLNSEWQEIERLVQSGVTPSGERMKEYLQVSCYKKKVIQDKKKVISCISDIMRLQEERYLSADPVLRDILVVLESGRSVEELRMIFTGVKP